MRSFHRLQFACDDPYAHAAECNAAHVSADTEALGTIQAPRFRCRQPIRFAGPTDQQLAITTSSNADVVFDRPDGDMNAMALGFRLEQRRCRCRVVFMRFLSVYEREAADRVALTAKDQMACSRRQRQVDEDAAAAVDAFHID